MRARAALRGARQALVEAEVGRLRAESSRAADDADAQLESVTGQPRGQPPLYLISPEAPRREPYPPEAVRRPLRGPRDRAGAVKAHMYR